MDSKTAHVGIEPGAGLVGRFGDTVILIPGDVAAAGGSDVAEELLGLIAAIASDPSASGSRIAARLAGWVLGRLPDEMIAFGMVAPVHEGVVIFLRGAVRAEVSGPGLARRLSGEQALTWVDQLIPGSFERLSVGSAGEAPVRVHPRSDLRVGVVPGRGFVVTPAGAFAGARPAAEPTAAGLAPVGAVPVLAPAVPPAAAVPAAAMPAAANSASVMPAAGIPAAGLPAPAMPDGAVPAAVVPPAAIVDGAAQPAAPVLGSAVPGSAVPAAAMPPAAMLNGAAPDGAAPDGAIPARAQTRQAELTEMPRAAGAPMPLAPTGPPSRPQRAGPTVVAPTPLGALVSDGGPTILLDRSYALGREPHNDPLVRSGEASPIVLQDPDHIISRVHAHISVDGGTVMIRDAGSTQGTYIAKPGADSWTRVGARPSVLHPGWSMRIGKLVFIFQTSGPISAR